MFLIAQATQPSVPPDLGGVAVQWIALIVSLLIAAAGFLTALGALLTAVHLHGKFVGHLTAVAGFLTHLSQQINGQQGNAATIARDLQAAVPAVGAFTAQLQTTAVPLPAVHLPV